MIKYFTLMIYYKKSPVTYSAFKNFAILQNAAFVDLKYSLR